MTLLKRLFNKKPASKTISRKKEQALTIEDSIAQLDLSSVDDIAAIAVGEHEHTLRVAAINKLPYMPALQELAFGAGVAKIQVPARQRLATLIDQKEISFEQLTADTTDKVALLAVASFSIQSQIQEQVLNGADEEFLYEIATAGPSAKLRHGAASCIHSRSKLEQLLRHSKGKDKTIYKMVKDKCDVFKEQDKLKQQAVEKMEQLCVAIERLSHRAQDPMFQANFTHLNEQWLQLQQQPDYEQSAAHESRSKQAIADCQQILDEQQHKKVEQEQQEAAVNSAAKERELILIELKHLLTELYACDEQTDQLHEKISASVLHQQQGWEQSVQFLPASKQQFTRYEQLSDAIVLALEHNSEYGTLTAQLQPILVAEDVLLKKTIDPLRQRLKYAYLLDQSMLPEPVVLAQNSIAAWDKKQHEIKAAIQLVVRQVSALIRRSIDALEKGQVRQAVGIRRSVEQKITELKKIPAALSEQLESLDEKLEKLQDWRSYAVEPKMHELVDKMQVLVDSVVSPDVRAEKIKILQDQWKKLSVGGGSQYQELWEKFHQLAQTAYEPCKVYFQQQAEVRAQNLQKRKDLVVQLEQFYDSNDWQNADWKLVEKMIRVAREEWRTYAPTDRAASKEVQVKFDAQLDKIQQSLDGEYKKNADLKQQLVDQAKLLASKEDVRESIEQVKRLQSTWKTLGVTAHKTDQKLWKEFRVQCDSVFEKREQQAQEFKAQLHETKDTALALCAQVEALVDLTDKALFEARTALEQLKTDFYALSTLPKASADSIKTRFSAAVIAFDNKVKKERLLAKEKIWVNLFTANTAVTHCELAVNNGEDVEQAKAKAQSVIDTIDEWPKRGREAIVKKLAQVNPSQTLDLVANENALKMLCIRMEILTDSETVAADQAMRMAYQVERLQHGLGQSARAPESGMTDLIFEWVAVGAVPMAAYETLLERFEHCRNASM